MFNPDARPKRMGAHVYHVEGLDLTAWGFPGLTFEGDADIEVDPHEHDWWVESVHALDAKGNTHRYAPTQPLGEAIIEALCADEYHSQLITDACWLHGED